MELWKQPEIAESYAKNNNITYPAAVAQYVLERLMTSRDNSKLELIVDAGCGNGRSLKWYLPYFHRAVGFDASEFQIDNARKLNKSPKVSYFVGQENKIAVEDGSVDLIIAAGSVHYMNVNDFVCECNRVLKQNGMVAIYNHEYCELIVDDQPTQVTQRNEKPKFVSGFDIFDTFYQQPVKNYFSRENHPNFDDLCFYDHLYSEISGMKKEKKNGPTLDYYLSLKEFKDHFLSEPAYKKHHELFPENSAPLNVMGQKLKCLSNTPELKDEELILKVTVLLHVIFLSKY
uniref:uncharacterized protein LOC120336815 n=1 Tax=Styela clava TaxID=7725 RepID=UPI0019396036|nr:uncharacterized protein LOC120336815 [Styela clava]XP_039260524.1 uncharacterized protein LOC120336815 [Styela clava]XP_039260525.1 uncharacterized protein LOC120336815 [Styela clava]